MTAASMGLAHGVYTKPSAPPTSRPERKPSPVFRGPNRASRERGASRRSLRPGTISATPKASSTTMATSRRGSLPSPTPSTTLASPTIVTVKVTESPSTIPRGRRRPPTPPAESSAGSTGSTHGESAVPAPARRAKPIRRIIVCSGSVRRGHDPLHGGSIAGWATCSKSQISMAWLGAGRDEAAGCHRGAAYAAPSIHGS